MDVDPMPVVVDTNTSSSTSTTSSNCNTNTNANANCNANDHRSATANQATENTLGAGSRPTKAGSSASSSSSSSSSCSISSASSPTTRKRAAEARAAQLGAQRAQPSEQHEPIGARFALVEAPPNCNIISNNNNNNNNNDHTFAKTKRAPAAADHVEAQPDPDQTSAGPDSQLLELELAFGAAEAQGRRLRLHYPDLGRPRPASHMMNLVQLTGHGPDGREPQPVAGLERRPRSHLSGRQLDEQRASSDDDEAPSPLAYDQHDQLDAGQHKPLKHTLSDLDADQDDENEPEEEEEDDDEDDDDDDDDQQDQDESGDQGRGSPLVGLQLSKHQQLAAKTGAGPISNEALVDQLARVQRYLDQLDDKFRGQDHRLATIESANQEILIKLEQLTRALESIAAPAALAAAVAAAQSRHQQAAVASSVVSLPDPNNNNQSLAPESASRSAQLLEQLRDAHSKSQHQGLFAGSPFILQHQHQHQQRQRLHHLNSHLDQDSSNQPNEQLMDTEAGQAANELGLGQLNCMSGQTSMSSSPSVSPVEPTLQQHLQHHQLHQSLLHNLRHSGGPNNCSTTTHSPQQARANSLAAGATSTTGGAPAGASGRLQASRGQQQHQLGGPASRISSSHNSSNNVTTAGSSRHSSASVSPALGPSGSPVGGGGGGGPAANALGPQHPQHQHHNHQNHLQAQQLHNSASQHHQNHQQHSNGAGQRALGPGAGLSAAATAQQILQAAVVAQQQQQQQQQQANQHQQQHHHHQDSNNSVAALAASQFLSALGQLGDADLLTQSRLLASTLSAAANANDLATNLSNQLAGAAAKLRPGSPQQLNSSAANNNHNHNHTNANNNNNHTHHQHLLATRHHGASQAAAANNQQAMQLIANPASPASSAAAAAAAVAAQLSAVARSSSAGSHLAPGGGQLNLTNSHNNAHQPNSGPQQTGPSAGAQLVQSIPHPHSHHALSHPATAAAAASLLINNPHYQTVRTKYSTRRYSRRRVGPQEALADPAIQATVNLKMPVVAKTILIVLRHRLTVQTAITLACADTGERLRKGAIQKKLEAMFREPGAVDNFMAEWDHPR